MGKGKDRVIAKERRGEERTGRYIYGGDFNMQQIALNRLACSRCGVRIGCTVIIPGSRRIAWPFSLLS